MLAHSWDEALGGVNFDRIISDFLAEKFIEIHGVDPRTSKKSLARLMK